MTAIELRAELFREMSPLLDSEAAMTKVIAFQLTHVHLVVVVPVQGADVAQVVAAYIGILLEGLTLHPLPDAVGDGLSGEALVDASVSSNGLSCDGLSCLPQVECRCVGCVVMRYQSARSKPDMRNDS